MTRPHKIALAVAVAISFLASTVYADIDAGVAVADAQAQVAPSDAAPVTGLVHLSTPSHVTTAGGTSLLLPAGYFLDNASYNTLDAQTKILQNNLTSLTAQNASLQRAASGYTPGWITVVGTLIVSLVSGLYAGNKL